MSFAIRTKFRDPARSPGDYIRAAHDGGTFTVAIANCYAGFRTWLSDGSSAVLGLYQQRWPRVAGTLFDCVTSVMAALVCEVPPLLAGLYPDPDEPPAASFLLAASRGTEIVVGWIGGEYGWLLRNGSVAAETDPHTFRREFRGKPHAPHPDVLTRTLSSAGGVPSSVHWQAMPGDVLCVASSELAPPSIGGDAKTVADSIIGALPANVGAVACVFRI